MSEPIAPESPKNLPEDQHFVKWKMETLKEIEKELRQAEPGGVEPGAGSAPPADWAPAPPDSSQEQGGLLEPVPQGGVPQPDVVPPEAELPQEESAPPVLGSKASVPQEAGAAAPAQPAPLDAPAPPSPPAPPLPPLPPAPLTKHLGEAAAEAAAEAVMAIPSPAPTGSKCTGAIKKVPQQTNKQLSKAKAKKTKRRHQSGGGHGGSSPVGTGDRGSGPGGRGAGPGGRGAGPVTRSGLAAERGAARGYGTGPRAGSATPRRE